MKIPFGTKIIGWVESHPAERVDGLYITRVNYPAHSKHAIFEPEREDVTEVDHVAIVVDEMNRGLLESFREKTTTPNKIVK